MSNQQFRIVLEMIIRLVEESDSIEQAVEKLRTFLK